MSMTQHIHWHTPTFTVTSLSTAIILDFDATGKDFVYGFVPITDVFLRCSTRRISSERPITEFVLTDIRHPRVVRSTHTP
jgi:hypothetical protein